jgi:hypothetical protein
MSGIDVLSEEEQRQIVESVVCHRGLRATVRSTGVPQNRIKSLLVNLGPACTRYQDKTLRGLEVSTLEWPQAFAFHAKARNTAASDEYSRTTGAVWTLACLDRRTKLIPAWRIGPRNRETFERLRADVARRYSSESVLPGACSIGREDSETRLHVSPGWFAALDRGFARKVERHAAVVALFFLHYNFATVHQDLGVTPAMAVGKATHVWQVAEIVELLAPPAAIRCTGESAPRQE